jgi:glycosyltransferase involved in cell wall biosynthesis
MFICMLPSHDFNHNISVPMVVQVGSNGSSTPTISVGVPVYNGENFLAELLNSIVNQTFGNFEIVISDNASTDRTADVCAEFVKRDARIRYHRNEKNIGPLNNFNRAFHLARGKYFCWMCHDDFIERTHLERCVRVLEQNDDVVLCFSDVEFIGPDGHPLPFDPSLGHFICGPNGQTMPIFPRHVAEQTDTVARFADLLARCSNCYESGLVRRDALAKTSLQKDFYGNGEIWLLELAMQGRFVMLDEKLFYRRFHPDSSFFVPKDSKDAWVAQAAPSAVNGKRFRFTRSYLEVIRQSTSLSELQRWQCYGHVLRKTGVGIARKFMEKRLRA